MGDADRSLDEQIRGVKEKVRSAEEELRSVEEQIRKVLEKIERVEGKIERVEGKIERVEGEIDSCSDYEKEKLLRGEKAQLRGEIALLWGEIGLLRAKESQLRDKELLILQGREGDLGPLLKKRRIERRQLQSFVQSASKHYRQWEQAEKAVDKAGEKAGVQKEGHKKFLMVSEDPLGNFEGALLIWIRKCYKDLKEIMAKAEASKRFTLLGTSGIGNSTFAIFWICYRATLKEKVVWKFSGGECYLLDFSEEGPSSENAKVAKAYGPFREHDPVLGVVYDDPAAWLIIDGKQSGNLIYSCHILLACSARKENYKTFSKNQRVSIRYIPVWAEEEIIEFLDDFEVLKANYSHMNVPVKDEAIGYFRKLGGVPRYVLCAAKVEERLMELERAVTKLGKKTSLNFFSARFEGEEEMSDCLVHMHCREGGYSAFFYDFASSYVQREFGDRFTQLSKVDVVEFLRANADTSWGGSAYGYIFELVAHEVMQRGGEFPMKRVGLQGKRVEAEEVGPLKLSNEMKVVRFTKVEELAVTPTETYYKPRNANFESVDALVSPDTLLQFFTSQRGKHGYKVNGLKTLHEQLKLDKYKLCSCVPPEIYEITNFQNWLKADNTIYVKEDKVLHLMDQFVVRVDYNNYSG